MSSVEAVVTQCRVIYWKHIPAVVIATDNTETARVELSPRFQAAIDAQAMAAGSTSDGEYSAGWRKTEWEPREGRPQEVAAAVAAELEAEFDTKEKLFIAALDYLLEHFRSGRGERLQAANGVRERLRAVLRHQQDLILTERTSLEVYYDYWVQSTKRDALRDKIRDMYSAWRIDLRAILEQGVEVGEITVDDIDLGASLIIAISQGAALQYVMDPRAFDPPAYFQMAERALASLFGVPAND